MKINGNMTVTAVPEASLLFTTYSKSFAKPFKATGIGEDDIWSKNNDDGARWMCQKTAATIEEGEWGSVISLVGEVYSVPYDAGEWHVSRPYSRDENKEPWVSFNGEIYRKAKNGTITGGKNPQLDYAEKGNKADWIRVEKQQAMFFHVLWAEKAIIAGAVANMNKMYSQFGMLNGAPSSEYWKEGFVPNLMIDWENGRIEAKSGVFSGYLSTPFKNLHDSDRLDLGSKRFLVQKDLNLMVGEMMSETVVLPNDKSYNGATVNICNNVFPPFTRHSLMYQTEIIVQGAGKFGNAFLAGTQSIESLEPSSISLIGGLLQFIGVIDPRGGGLKWLVIGYKDIN